MDDFHAWYSAKSENHTQRQDVQSFTPVYVNEHGEIVRVTFVTRERELDFFSSWDDLEYKGIVRKKMFRIR